MDALLTGSFFCFALFCFVFSCGRRTLGKWPFLWMSDAALQSDPQSVRKVREGAAAWWFWHPSIMLGAQKASCSSQTIFTHSFMKFYINFLFFFFILSNFRLMEFLEVAPRTPYILLHRFTYSFSFAQFALYLLFDSSPSHPPPTLHSVCVVCAHECIQIYSQKRHLHSWDWFFITLKYLGIHFLRTRTSSHVSP